MNKKKIIILSGPSGVGKDTVINLWQKINPSIHKVVTCTTRPIREGEEDGVDYTFMYSAEFEKKIEEGKFIEYVKIYDHYYGTPKDSIFNSLKKDTWVILKIDAVGALKLTKIFPEAMTIFLLPPSLQELEKRILKRGKESHEQIQKRLSKAQDEMKQSEHYNHVIINENLDCTVIKLESILKDILFN